ncbi:MAG: LysE family transporter [Marinilabiliales bacterium]|nr:LysE family transporter [Marinilabiliales bacterium]
MEYLPLIGTVFLLNLLAAMSPGPDFVMTVRNSLLYSRRAGIFTSFGIALGLGVHLLYCAAGIGYLISTSVVLFTVIKLLGAGYLIYMGVGAFVSRGSRIEFTEKPAERELTAFSAFKMGFLTNVLNPKATLFFLSLFTLVINHNTPLFIVLIISLLIILTAISWFVIVSVFLTSPNIRRVFLAYERGINRVLGLFLILLGIKIALTFLK